MIVVVPGRRKHVRAYTHPSKRIFSILRKYAGKIQITQWLLGILCVTLFFLAIRYVFVSTIFRPEYFIHTVKYSSGSVQVFDDPLLYKTITRFMKHQHYYLLVWFGKKKLLKNIRTFFPIVQSINIYLLDRNTAAVDVQFYSPLFVLTDGNKRFAVYDPFTIVRLYPQNTLGQKAFVIRIADYASGWDDMSGIFFRTNPKYLYDMINKLDAYLHKPYDLLYLPGAEKIRVITADKKVLYFTTLDDIQKQLKKLSLLKKWYTGFDSLRLINLTSLDSYSIIVSK